MIQYDFEDVKTYAYSQLVDAIQYLELGLKYKAILSYSKACLWKMILEGNDIKLLEEDEEFKRLWNIYKDWEQEHEPLIDKI